MNLASALAMPLEGCEFTIEMGNDNARSRTAALTRNHLAANNIGVIDWPVLSPDMNPIGQIWNELRWRVKQKHLRAELISELNNTPNALMLRYVNSMRRRIQALITANGGHTVIRDDLWLLHNEHHCESVFDIFSHIIPCPCIACFFSLHFFPSPRLFKT